MHPSVADWHLKPQHTPPDWLIELLNKRSPNPSNKFAAQLLWQCGIQDPQSVSAFLDPHHYQPTSPWAFGEEMHKAIARLQQARDHQETVFIWGDFDADGITATAVLWEGLSQFFVPDRTLRYTIPNRLTDSHGLSRHGLDAIAAQGCQLIVTCDTGSSDRVEIEYAQMLGIDTIVTDHHTLPSERPPVVAFLNPRTFPPEHPLAHLSGVAVAYKLIEALYETFADISPEPLDSLLDLVAIGLIADLVKLTGDCRYLAQKGLIRLKQQLDAPTRPGVAKLLELCRRNGDRPSDISFGLGPRINAISRIQGDARIGVELLTTRDPERAAVLAESAEWTNLCRKEVQQRVVREAEMQLDRLDFEAIPVIVLSDPQWPVGVLGLVASQIAQTYGRPTILLSTASPEPNGKTSLARGSARSVAGVDLYELLGQQAHLLHRFGGHPFAAGLSLPIQNLPLFIASIHQSARQKFEQWLGQWKLPVLEIDLELCLSDVVVDQGSALFQALGYLEPYGMGHPAPRLLIRNSWLERCRSSRYQNFGYQNFADQKLQFKKTQFQLRDDSTSTVFPGVWWGHDAEELPEGRCDVVVELEYGRLFKTSEFHARLVAVRPAESDNLTIQTTHSAEPWLLDWRSQSLPSSTGTDAIRLEDCPSQWEDLDLSAKQAKTYRQKLALAYSVSDNPEIISLWQQLAGMVKYAVRTGHPLPVSQMQTQLGLTERSLFLGIEALQTLGFKIDLNIDLNTDFLTVQSQPFSQPDQTAAAQAIQRFMESVAEDQFQHRYFQNAPVENLQRILDQRIT